MKNRKMIKALPSLIMTFALAMTTLFGAIPAQADTLPETDPGWYVTLNSAGKLESNFSSDTMAQTISDMQPGDEAVFRIAVNNEYNDKIDWYMENSVLYSLEDRSANEGTAYGAYAYKLTYTGTNGEVNTLFDSDTIGGDTVSPAGEGLKAATDSLDDWMLLEQMGAGTKGVVELHVTLDGETQGNNYQDTLADLMFKFSVEFPAEEQATTTVTVKESKVPKTGDQSNTWIFVIIMAVAVVLAALAFILLYKNRRKEKTAEGPEVDEQRRDE